MSTLSTLTWRCLMVRRKWCALIVCLVLAPGLARAQVGPSAEDGKAVATWIAARAKAAASGAPELVRVPLSFRSLGWGCVCPDVFIGTSPHSHDGGDTWVKVLAAPGLTLPGMTREGAVLVAEAIFTGKRVKLDLRGKDGPKEHLYQIWELKVLRTKTFREGGGDAKVQIVLPARQLAEKVPPLADDRPWIVVVESYPLTAKRSLKVAEGLQKKLVAAGFTGAEVLDSRRAARLYCCYQVVAAGRFKTKAEAMAVAKQVRAKKWKDVTVRQGW